MSESDYYNLIDITPMRMYVVLCFYTPFRDDVINLWGLYNTLMIIGV